jgi:hypothetical protein
VDVADADKIKANILWLERDRYISVPLLILDYMKKKDSRFSYELVSGTNEAQEKISNIEGLQLIVSNIAVDELDGLTIPDFLKYARETVLKKDIPILIYSLSISNPTVSSIPMCKGSEYDVRFNELKIMKNMYYLGWNANNLIFEKAVLELQDK